MTWQPGPPHSERMSPLVRYTLAVVFVLVSLAIRRSIHSAVMTDLPLLGMPFAVFFAAYFGGIGPGILATALAALIAAWEMPPAASFGVSKLTDQVRLVSFLSLGILISLMNERARRLQARFNAHELALSESRYLTLVYQSPEPILVLTSGVIGVLNTPMVELLGPGRRQGLLHEPLLNFVHPDDRKLMQLWLTDLRPGASKSPSPLRFVRLDGAVVEAMVALEVFESAGQRRIQVTLSEAPRAAATDVSAPGAARGLAAEAVGSQRVGNAAASGNV
jgi:two-component system sensor histidine kinase/response regulator